MGKFVSVALAICAFIPCVNGDPYLAVIGPTPIRLQPTPQATLAALLPPLQPTQTNTTTVPAPAAVTDQASTPPPPPPVFEPIVVQAGTQPTYPWFTLPNGTVEPPPEPLTAQMLVPYFRDLNLTNNLSTVFVAPFSFVPPTPLIRPSSQATYIVPGTTNTAQ